MNIFAIIVTYNAMHRSWIDRCLQSLKRSTTPVIPIVVDNCSTDGTREHVPSHYPDAIWLPQDHNLGFGQANNAGIRYALDHAADYVLLLNQDAAIAPDTIERMLAVSDGESLISPLHLNGDGTRIDEMFRISLKLSTNQMLDDLLIRKTLSDSYESAEICAACWLMPIALIQKIGGFNPLFFHYSEDNNYYHRMIYHGVKTLLVPKAQMYHDRLLQGNMQAFNRKRLRRDLVLEATNIDLSFAKRCTRWLKVLYKCYTRDLLQHSYIPGAWCVEMGWLLLHAPTIHHSRKQEKQIQPNWL
ncbi:MAG: glycosyltransferase family 2 protein [Bacteroidaceae bacterium]|nr:glycosyltransferase family 2 protein [Bacteroidaceae bacterium]